MSRTTRSRGVSSYRTKKRSKRIKLSKRRNKLSNKRLNRKSFKRVSKRMRNNRKSYKRRGGAPPSPQKGSKSRERAQAEKEAQAAQAEKEAPEAQESTEPQAAPEAQAEQLYNVVCKGSTFTRRDPRTGKLLRKDVRFYILTLYGVGGKSSKSVMRWSEFLNFIKDVEKKIKAMKRDEDSSDFSSIYNEKMDRVYGAKMREKGYGENYVYKYISSEGGSGSDREKLRLARESIINEYFTAIDGSWTSVYSAFNFQGDETTNLLKLASEKDIDIFDQILLR